METPVQGVMTRSRSRQSPSPIRLQDVQITPGEPSAVRSRRKAQVYGTPISAIRTALCDVTNDSPRGVDISQLSANKIPNGLTSWAKSPNFKVHVAKEEESKAASATDMEAAEGDIIGGGGSPGSNSSKGEEALRLEVSRIMASQPEAVETPVLTKKRLAVTGESGPGGDQSVVQDKNKEQDAAKLVLVPASPVPVGMVVKGKEASSPVCFSPTSLLAPTPGNTPSSPLDGSSLQALDLAQVVKACGRSFSVPASPGAAAAKLAPTPASSPAPSSVVSKKLPSGKPPMPRPAKNTPRRPTPQRKAKLNALRIATPIGKTPPPRVARRDEEEKSYDPAHLLQAIAAVESEELIASAASSPDRPTRALSFSDSPAALASTPAFALRWREDFRGEEIGKGAAGSSAGMPPSPAWSLDVNISPPALKKRLMNMQADNTDKTQAMEEEGLPGEEEEEDEEEEEWEGAENEDVGEDFSDLCEAVSGLSVSGRCMALRGLPHPSGNHIRFDDDDEDNDVKEGENLSTP